MRFLKLLFKMVWDNKRRAEAQREWRRKNPERYKEIQIKSRQKCKERIRGADKKWRTENRLRYREIVNKSSKKYAKDHPEKSRENYQRHKLEYKIRKQTATRFKKDDSCNICRDKNKLEFHHWIYKEPLEKKHFSTLCNFCHNAQHNGGIPINVAS